MLYCCYNLALQIHVNPLFKACLVRVRGSMRVSKRSPAARPCIDMDSRLTQKLHDVPCITPFCATSQHSEDVNIHANYLEPACHLVEFHGALERNPQEITDDCVSLRRHEGDEKAAEGCRTHGPAKGPRAVAYNQRGNGGEGGFKHSASNWLTDLEFWPKSRIHQVQVPRPDSNGNPD